MSRGFTLLEVLVALAIVALAVVTMVQLSAHGLRLLRTSEDYQEAVRLADRAGRALQGHDGHGQRFFRRNRSWRLHDGAQRPGRRNGAAG